MDKVQHRFDNLIKPVGSLAKLEKIVCRYAALKNTTTLDYPSKALVLFDYTDTAKEHLPFLQAADSSNTLFSVAQGDLLTLPQADVIAFGHTLNNDAHTALREKIISAMSNAMLRAYAENKMIVLDGKDSIQAATIAYQKNRSIYKNFVCSFIDLDTEEPRDGYFDISPLLALSMPSENGLGALLTFSVIDAGVRAYKDMKTFDEAKVEYAVEDLQ